LPASQVATDNIAALRGPDFIVIGAMKCGTTTLYQDLARHPMVALTEKENNHFARPDALDPDSIARYLYSFTGADSGDHRVGECSTHYAMLPTPPGIAERVRGLLGDDVRIIYMVRNPVVRSISHHHHLLARGGTTLGFEDALVQHPEILDYSRYEQQLEPWDDVFGKTSVLVVPLEGYNSEWVTWAKRIAEHIGVDVAAFPSQEAGHANQTSDARVLIGKYRSLYQSRLGRAIYQDGLRKLLPNAIRQRLRKAVLPAPPARPQTPVRAALEMMIREFAPAAVSIRTRCSGFSWDLAATVQRLDAERGRTDG